MAIALRLTGDVSETGFLTLMGGPIGPFLAADTIPRLVLVNITAANVTLLLAALVGG